MSMSEVSSIIIQERLEVQVVVCVNMAAATVLNATVHGFNQTLMTIEVLLSCVAASLIEELQKIPTSLIFFRSQNL